MPIKFCSSVLLVKDIEVSREFYERILKQVVESDFGENIGFESGLALWQIDYAYKVMSKDIAKCVFSKDSSHFEIYFESDDLDATYNMFKNKNIEFVHDMIEQPWGQRAFRIYDPDNHMVELGEPMTAVVKRFLTSGLTTEEVAKRTSMPIEIVQKVAEED